MGRPKTNRTANLQRNGLSAASLQSKQYTVVKKRLAASTEANYELAQDLWNT
jgi:hypothetical protein